MLSRAIYQLKDLPRKLSHLPPKKVVVVLAVVVVVRVVKKTADSDFDGDHVKN